MKITFLSHVRTVAIALAASLVSAIAAVASPLCLLPGPADAGVLRAAPEECLFYLGWNGAGKADAKSENQTEQLLAEKEVQAFLSQIETQVTALVQQAMRGNPAAAAFADDLPALVKGVLTRPAALYVSKVAFGPMGPDVQAGLIINTGDLQPTFAKAVAQLEAMALTQLPPGMKLEELNVAGAKLHRAPLPPGAPVVVWGFKDSYFLLSVGVDAGQELVKRLSSGSPPAWLAKVQQEAAVERPGVMWYVNVAGILQTARPFMTDPKAVAALEAFGIPSINHISSVSGFDRTGMMSKTLLATDGAPAGILAALSGAPLTAADVQPVPKDVNFAVAARLDAAKILRGVLDAIAQIDPAARAQAERAFEELDSQLGFSLADDVLAVLGDAWCAYGIQAKPAPGKPAPQLGDLALTVTVRDRKRFDKAYQALVDRLKQQSEKSNGAWTVKQSSYKGQQVYYVSIKSAGAPPAAMPFNFEAMGSGAMPCWCLTDERLVVCSNPQALKTFLTRSDSDPSLASQDELAPWFKASEGPLMITYSDTAAGLRSAYPQLQAAIPLASAGLASAGLNFQIPALPSLTTLERHARPSILLVKQTAAGLVTESHETVPMVNSRSMATSGVGIALLLPAVQAAREAARRTQSSNNLKQIGLGLVNFADVYKSFPAAAVVDKQGRPLLSWRVAILPYVEQQELYNRFHLDEPWDSEHNKALIALMPIVYRNPNLPAASEGKTNYLAVAGENATLQPKKGTTFPTITDGTSNTIAVVEANADRAVIWTKPDDWSPNEKEPLAGLLGFRAGGFLALFADGSVRFLSQSVNPNTFKAMLTRNGGEVINVDEN